MKNICQDLTELALWVTVLALVGAWALAEEAELMAAEALEEVED